MPRVLYIIPANSQNGFLKYSSFVKREIKAVENKGVDTECYFFTARLNPVSLLRASKELKDIISSFRPDILHAQFGTVTSYLVSNTKPEMPWLITFGGNDLLGHPNKGLYWRLRERLALFMSHTSAKRATRLICVSNNLLEALPKNLERKAEVIPRGIDMDRFAIIDRVEARRKLGWEKNGEVILFNQARQQATVKNYPLAEKAVGVYNCLFTKNATLKILMNMTPEEVNFALNASDVLLVTSLHEGSPNIVKEAMACNLPVVTVPCGDVRERLKDVKPSYIGDYNADDLARGLNAIIGKDARSNGREQIIEQKIRQEDIALRIARVYESMISSK